METLQLFYDPRMATSIPSVKEMNKHFVIKWRFTDEPDNGKFNRLIGAGQYAKKFGEDYMKKHFVRAFEAGQQKLTVAIRGKYVITFHSK